MSDGGPRRAPSHIGALDVLVEVLGGADDPTTPDAFYGRLCAAVCRLTEISRAAIFRYDGAQRRVRVVGAHGVALSVFADLHANVESAAIARQALEADQVIEVAESRTEELPAGYASLVGTDRLVCAPMRAADRWVEFPRFGGHGLIRRRLPRVCGQARRAGRAAIRPLRCYHRLMVKQLLLRVPQDVHRRLAERAKREGRSVNAMATEILDAAAAGDQGDRRARLRAAATAAGALRSVQTRRVSAARRKRILGSTRGLGAQVDRLLDQERDRV
jgi:plasmid stability protein